MKRTLLTLILLAAAAWGAYGQETLLLGNAERTALYLDPGRIWNYNHYEHSRWGVGLRLVTHPHHFIFNKIDASAYLGYGLHDQQWKGGIGLSEHWRGSRLHGVFYQRAVRDFRAAGSRRIANPWNESGQLLGDFMARRMTDEQSITLGHRWHTARWRWAVEATWGKRGWLFDENRLLFLGTDNINYANFLHLRLLLRHSCGVSAMLEAAPDGSMARLLADYRRNIPLGFFSLDIFAQAGITPEQNEYIDMFDLGGMWGAPVYTGHSLITARPNEFTTNAFTLLNLRFQTSKPLYKIYSSLFNVGSNPVPFVAFNAVWGMLWNQDTDGQMPWRSTYLQAPNRGIVEPTVGVNGLIRFGLVDWGLAFTYRYVPDSAPYHFSPESSNFVLLITASLIP